jgi:hypothetical protein
MTKSILMVFMRNDKIFPTSSSETLSEALEAELKTSPMASGRASRR